MLEPVPPSAVAQRTQCGSNPGVHPGASQRWVVVPHGWIPRFRLHPFTAPQAGKGLRRSHWPIEIDRLPGPISAWTPSGLSSPGPRCPRRAHWTRHACLLKAGSLVLVRPTDAWELPCWPLNFREPSAGRKHVDTSVLPPSFLIHRFPLPVFFLRLQLVLLSEFSFLSDGSSVLGGISEEFVHRGRLSFARHPFPVCPSIRSERRLPVSELRFSRGRRRRESSNSQAAATEDTIVDIGQNLPRLLSFSQNSPIP